MTQEARLPRGWIRGTTLIVTGLLLACALIALTNAGSISADDPWPTPPPGPRPSVPKVIVDDGIKPVDTPLVAGATKWVVLPLAMLLPRFPPVPSSSFQAPDDVRIVSDAGSIDSTIQLVYEPIPAADAQPPGPHQSLRKAFDLRTFDHQANRITLDLRRPWLLEVPIRGLIQSFEDPARFLIARYDEKSGWVPLVTSYYRNQGVLQVRILQVGRFAILAEPGVI